MITRTALWAGLIMASAGIAACGGGEKGEAPAAEKAAPMDDAARLGAVIAGEHRTAEERARDPFRHPHETLMFFGMEPGMTVVEVYPGGGWYTQIIAPYLKDGGGKLYAAAFAPEGANERTLAAIETFRKTYAARPEIYGDIELTALGEGHHIAPEGSADMVVTFRNIHSFMGSGKAEFAFAEFYRALKPGGVLGVVEHRADGSALPRDGSSGYVYTDDVKAMAEAAGFELDMESEINANPKDAKDHPFGVWTLPPVRRSSEVRGQETPGFDRAFYDAIGESDRMTLKFRKPLAADGALLQ